MSTASPENAVSNEEAETRSSSVLNRTCEVWITFTCPLTGSAPDDILTLRDPRAVGSGK